MDKDIVQTIGVKIALQCHISYKWELAHRQSNPLNPQKDKKHALCLFIIDIYILWIVEC